MFGKKKSEGFDRKNFEIKKSNDFSDWDIGKKNSQSISSRIKSNFFFSFIITVIKSLNPDAYPRLSSKKVLESFSYLSKLVIAMLIITSAIFLPHLFSVGSSAEKRLSEFSSMSLNIQSSSPVQFSMGNLNAAIDSGFNSSGNSSASELSKYDFLITPEGIWKKPLPCIFWETACLFYRPEDKIIHGGESDFFDVLKNKQEYSRIIGILTLMMLPSVLILLFFLYSVKYAVLSILMAALMYFAAKGLKHHVNFRRILNVSIHALTIMVILQMLSLSVNFLGGIFLFLPFSLFLLIFIAGTIILQEEYV